MPGRASAKIRAMPTASVTAPPVRPCSDSCTSFSIADQLAAGRGAVGIGPPCRSTSASSELSEIMVRRQKLGTARESEC